MTIFSIVLTLQALFLAAFADQFCVQNAPDYLKFVDANELRLSEFPSIISALYGFSDHKDVSWKGLVSGSPFKKPEAVVVIEGASLDTLHCKTAQHKYTLNYDEETAYIYSDVSEEIRSRFPKSNPVLIEVENNGLFGVMKSTYPDLLNLVPEKAEDLEAELYEANSVVRQWPPKALNTSERKDLAFLVELQLVKDVFRQVEKKSKHAKDGVPDLYWIRFSAFNDIIAAYGPKSNKAIEASEMIEDLIKTIVENIDNAYKKSAAVFVLSLNTEKELVRRRRADPDPPKQPKLAKEYDENYPAAFNIIFLVMLIFALSVFAVALGMWHIDPGRDSIIYRMTSQRMKKDQ